MVRPHHIREKGHCNNQPADHPNEQAGKWPVTVTDLYTDQPIEHSFTVQ